MSQDIGNPRTYGFGGFLLVLGLVVAGGVDDQFAEELSGGGGDDPNVEVLHDHDLVIVV
jgi:hypothetical protein